MYLYHYCKKINDYLFEERIPFDKKNFLIKKFRLQYNGMFKEYWDKNVRILTDGEGFRFDYITDDSVVYKGNYLINKFESKICTKYSFYNVDCEMEYRLYTATQAMVRYILKEYETYIPFEYECPNITNIKLF